MEESGACWDSVPLSPRLRRENSTREMLSQDGLGHGGGVLLPSSASLGDRNVPGP